MGPNSSEMEKEAVSQVIGHRLAKAGDHIYSDCCLCNFPPHTLLKGTSSQAHPAPFYFLPFNH